MTIWRRTANSIFKMQMYIGRNCFWIWTELWASHVSLLIY